jgi:histidinol phosphatase-like PHP family hydrolase
MVLRNPTQIPTSTAGTHDKTQQIANLVYDLAEAHRPSPRYWGYKRAARTIRQLPWPLSDLTEREILTIPAIGPATYRVIREVLTTGRSQGVERAVTESGKGRDIEQRRAFRHNFLSRAMVHRILKESRPGALQVADYLGDFQMHSTSSDGYDTLDELVEACRDRGYRCACMTDHSYGLPIAKGMSIETMKQQCAEIDAINARYGDAFRLFKGVEANILADGKLDLQPDERRGLDLVVASPHSALRKRDDQTGRMLEAVSQPGVHILGHPRGRVFNLRAGIVADWPRVFERASQTRVAIELDGDTSRQDLDFELAVAARDAGCLFALDSDAHGADQLFMADYAIAHARLADIPADRIVNCWEPDRILEWAQARWQP